MGMKHKNLKTNQSGLVSILVSMIIMLIMTIVVITYSQIISREQRQTLDRELSTQAYYAAESAINTVLAALNNGATVDALKSDNGTCTTTSTAKSTLTKLQEYDASHATSYFTGLPTGNNATITCLIVDTSNFSLAYSAVSPTASQIAHLQPANPAEPISQIEIAWQDTVGSAPSYPPDGTNFTPATGWPSGWPSVLQVEVVPWSTAGNSADSLLAASQVYFLYPKSVPGATTTFSNPADDHKGELIYGACDDATPNQPKFCRATLTVPPGNDFYLRIRPVYRSASIVVTPQNNAGLAINLSQVQGKGQIVVDVTARSADVVKRISVSSSAAPNYLTPDFAVAAASNICKRIKISSTLATTDTECGLN